MERVDLTEQAEARLDVGRVGYPHPVSGAFGQHAQGAHGGQVFRCGPLEQLGAVDDVGHE